MAAFASAAFTGTEGAELSSVDGNWTRHTSYSYNCEIASNRLRATTSSQSSAYYHSGSPSSADYTVSADVYIAGYSSGNTANDGGAGVIGRVDTSANTFYLARYQRLQSTSVSAWQLFKAVAGTFTQLGSNASKSVSAGNSYSFSLYMSGTTIELWDGETPVIQPAADSAISAAGKAGIRINSGPNVGDTTAAHLDNFSAEGSGTTVTTGAGALTLTGHAPTILGGNTNVSVGAGALTITGAAPAITTQETVSVGAGALTLTGHAPTIQVVAPGAVAVPSAALTLTGHAPTVTTQIVVSPDVAALAITGYAPTLQVVSDTVVQTGVGALTIAGHAPTASILLNVLPGTGQIVITGHAPTILGGTPSVVARPQAGGGKSSKPSTRRRKPILVNVDGEEFVVHSEAEAVELIEKAREVAESNARAQSAAILEKRKLKAARDGKLNTTPLRLDEPSITVTPAQDGYIDRSWVAAVDAQINDAIREAYESAARDAETQLLLAQRIMVDEEDTVVALLLTL